MFRLLESNAGGRGAERSAPAKLFQEAGTTRFAGRVIAGSLALLLRHRPGAARHCFAESYQRGI